jgi:hypothetical protein
MYAARSLDFGHKLERRLPELQIGMHSPEAHICHRPRKAQPDRANFQVVSPRRAGQGDCNLCDSRHDLIVPGIV